MALKALEMVELLPKTDCRKCGHGTCRVFAAELAQRQASVDACPDLTEEAKMLLMKFVDAERDMMSALRRVKTGDVKSVLSLLNEFFIVIPLRVIGMLIFTFPLSAPVWLFIIWMFMR